jgi:hypothetical protein
MDQFDTRLPCGHNEPSIPKKFRTDVICPDGDKGFQIVEILSCLTCGLVYDVSSLNRWRLKLKEMVGED